MRINCLVWSFILLGSAVVLTNCGVGSNSNNPSTSPNTGNTINGSQAVQISNISTIPAGNSVPGEYTLISIKNNLDQDISLQNTKIMANGQTLTAASINSYIDLSQCMQIAKHGSCNARILTNPTYQSYLLSVTYSNNLDSYTANQVVSFNSLLPTQNGFIYDATQLNANNRQLSIPFRLAASYSNINVLINDQPAEFSCYKNSYSINTLCTAIIKNVQAASSNTVKIMGYDNNSQVMANSILLLTNSTVANIVTSGVNVVINPDDGTSPQTVYLLNNGLTTATGLTIIPTNPVTVTSTTCGKTLAAGSGCSFVINVTGSVTSGQSSVSVSYSNSQTSQILFFNVSYQNQVTPALTLTSNGNFTNIVQNTGPIYLGINISNTGNTTLTGMKFSNVALQRSTISSFVVGSTCIDGMTLNIGQSCTMILSYAPTTTESSGSINFLPTASYTAPNGQTLTYANSIVNITYSAIASGSFVVIGNYGIVFHSTNSPPTTWAIDVDSPFSTTTESANGLVINGNTFVIMKNTGQVESSNQGGLFWKVSGNTNISTSTCGIVTDGTTYYICGTPSISIGNCTSTTRGCIESSSNLTTWSGTFMPAQNNVVFNDIYYYTNGTNKAYIATVGNATANTGIAASTNGITFSAPTSTGLAPANSNLLGTAFNTATNTIAAWATTGFSTSVGIASITGTWTNGGTGATNRPANSQVRAAIFQNGRYTVTTAAGNIYTATTNAGPYTQVYTGSTPINWITYGNGTYLAVGNNSAIIESATGGSWSAQTSFFGSRNLYSAYFESVVTNKFWITGTNVLAFADTTSPPGIWNEPSVYNMIKTGNTYITGDKFGGLYTATSLNTWTTRTNPSGKPIYHFACPQTGLCIAVGESGVILKTTNSGTTWTQLSSPVPTSVILHDIECSPTACVAVGGQGTANTGTVAVSTDFTNWTLTQSSLAISSFIAIAYYTSANLFIASGVGGSIFVSTNNGLTWLSVPAASALDVYSMTCSNNICIGVGNTGNIIRSLDGINWTSQTSGTTNQLGTVVFNGLFVTVGANGTMLSSSDGITWSSAGTIPASSSSITSLVTVIAN